MWRSSRLTCRVQSRQVRYRSWFPNPTESFGVVAKQTKDLLHVVAPPPLKTAALQTHDILESVGKANLRVLDRILDPLAPPRACTCADGENHITDSRNGGRPDQSYFWEPSALDSPFVIGRQAYLKSHRKHTARELVPDEDVERYVDSLLESNVLRNAPLPVRAFVSTRQLYIRVVRVVLGVVLHVCDMAEGDVLGKQMVWLKTPSDISLRSGGSRPLDRRIITRLAERVLQDHMETSTFVKLGTPESMVLALYEDIFALSIRFIFDIALTFKIRCLGHTVKISIDADDMLHTAPGWDVPLDQGAFGRFEDAEKRRWAASFVKDLLEDDEVRMTELPLALQQEMYSTVVVMLSHLAETALNHSRCHVAGMSLRPALDLEKHA